MPMLWDIDFSSRSPSIHNRLLILYLIKHLDSSLFALKMVLVVLCRCYVPSIPTHLTWHKTFRQLLSLFLFCINILLSKRSRSLLIIRKLKGKRKTEKINTCMGRSSGLILERQPLWLEMARSIANEKYECQCMSLWHIMNKWNSCEEKYIIKII